ncbi:MAG: hypothetical protein BroJett022_14150 [Actinomycetes bacterium]|nr:MAG: hypothetical protein BroJett022_14150 [Actinomycetes bacterium]
MRRALVRSLALLACLIVAAAAAPPALAKPDGKRGVPDGGGAVEVSGEQNAGYGSANPLVVENPLCSEGLRRAERRNCRMTGTPEGRYPASNYGLEAHIDTGLDNIVGNFQALLAQIANAIWLALLFVLNLVLTLLGWAFELNPFGHNQTMAEISRGLERFYRAFTSPWLVAAMVAIGAAGIWRGLVRRDAAGAIGGALLSVVLIVAALWVIHAPDQSVGRATELANQAATSVIAAPQAGSLRDPDATYAEATAEVWEAMTMPGFAALNFSNVDWALKPPDPKLLEEADKTACLDYAYLRSLPERVVAELAKAAAFGGDVNCKDLAPLAPRPETNAEIWLRSSPGSPARDSLWDEFADDHPYAGYMAIQGGGGAWTRLPLVALIALGLLGGIALLAWLAVRIFTQTAVAFVLVLSTPLALFLPVFGEGGRRAFGFWATTLLGALLSKLVYAAILSVVLLATTTVASLVRGGGGVGALMSFLVMAALWWAVFLKREQLIAAISLPGSGEGGGGRLEGLTGLYGGIRLGRAIARPLGAAAGAGGGAAGAAAGGFLGARAADRAEGTSRLARGQLDRRAERRLDARYEAERQVVERQRERKAELGAVAAERRALLGSAAAASGSEGGDARHGLGAEAWERAERLGERERELRHEIAAQSERARSAAAFVGRAEERERSRGGRWGGRELAEGRELIRREVDRPLDSGAHAWRVGLSPERYEALTGREREEAHGRVARELRADRLAFGAIPDRPEGAVDPRRQRGFRRELARGEAEGRRQLRGAEAAARRERRSHRAPSPRRGVSR